jgi:hypothetical protein
MASKAQIKAAARPKPVPAPAAALAPAQAQPEPNLLRAPIDGLNPEQREQARVALLATIQESIAGLHTCRLQDVAQFVDIVENDAGCTTPAESFITSIVNDHYREEGLTPELAAWEIERPDGFRISFRDAIDTGKRFNAMYPKLMNARQSPKPEPMKEAAAAQPAASSESPRRHERCHSENMAAIASRLSEFTNDFDSMRLLAFIDILQDESGLLTPLEHLVTDLVGEYCHRGVTPEYVEERSQDFRQEFEEAMRLTRLFTAEYADSIKAAPASAAA